MITHQQEKYNWDFVFLGANQDAIASGGAMGFKAGNSMTFAATKKGTEDTYESMSANMTTYRSAARGQSCSFFTDEDKAKQEL